MGSQPRLINSFKTCEKNFHKATTTTKAAIFVHIIQVADLVTSGCISHHFTIFSHLSGSSFSSTVQSHSSLPAKAGHICSSEDYDCEEEEDDNCEEEGDDNLRTCATAESEPAGDHLKLPGGSDGRSL